MSAHGSRDFQAGDTDRGDLRSRYTIGYRPTDSKPAGSFCRVRVALTPGAPLRPKEWQVLVREGYYRK